MEKLWLALLLCLAVIGCTNNSSSSTTSSEETGRRSSVQQLEITTPGRMQNSMVAPINPAEIQDNLRAMRLSSEQLEKGWLRLYDGREMTGWFIIGSANWQFGGGILSADGGEPSLFCTSFQLSDFELLVDFNCAEGTESGILLRTSADPRDLERDGYELNIAPPGSEYPTGSLVRRQKPDEPALAAPNQWHSYRVTCRGDQVDAWLDEQPVLHYTDPRKLGRGYIGLQYTQGVVRFRNILMRPLGSQALPLNNDWETAWKKVDPSGTMALQIEPSSDGLRLKGGPGQLESKEQWSDFVLQARYQAASEEVDSGILFRCLPDRFNEGYECQLYDGEWDRGKRKLQTGSLSVAARTGELVNARVLASVGMSPTYVTIIAEEGQFTSFVNGVIVADVADTREPSSNARAGFHRDAGPIALQAPDELTDITFHRIEMTPIRKR